MRKAEREITEIEEMEQVIMKAEVCRLGMIDDGEPYIVPMNFGYRTGSLFFHCAREGKKLDVLRKNPKVCFELESEACLVKGERACQWSSSYRSIIGWGNAFVLMEEADIKYGLEVVMDHYSPDQKDFDPRSMGLTAIIRVDVGRMTGKRSKR
jgi:uncharacterized protein